MISVYCLLCKQEYLVIVGDDLTPLSDSQLQRIFTNRHHLIQTIDIEDSGLLAHMYSKNCITQLQKQEIISVDKLLEIVQRKSVADFNKFLECLSASGQKHISTLLTQDAG